MVNTNNIKKVDALFNQIEYQNVKPVKDGIINIEKYKVAKPKILWILKEPHDKGNGGWDMRDFLINPKNLTERKDNWKWKKTYKMLMLVTWGILHDFQSYDKTLHDWGRLGDEEMLFVINEIALINLKKTPGGSSSPPPVIRAAYKTNKEIIWLQINTVKPDVVICGGTYQFIKKDIDQLSKSQCVFIDNYHPNFRSHKNHIDYYNEILTDIKLKLGK